VGAEIVGSLQASGDEITPTFLANSWISTLTYATWAQSSTE
jgi:hypothetical protein